MIQRHPMRRVASSSGSSGWHQAVKTRSVLRLLSRIAMVGCLVCLVGLFQRRLSPTPTTATTSVPDLKHQNESVREAKESVPSDAVASMDSASRSVAPQRSKAPQPLPPPPDSHPSKTIQQETMHIPPQLPKPTISPHLIPGFNYDNHANMDFSPIVQHTLESEKGNTDVSFFEPTAEQRALSTQLMLALRRIEHDQIQLLDWLNGESLSESIDIFGGSLVNHPSFNATETYVRILEHAQSLSSIYNRVDFSELARRARTLHILLRVSLLEVDAAVFSNSKVREAMATMMLKSKEAEEAVVKLTGSLFPWLAPTFNSIEVMRNASRKGQEWGIVITGGSKHFYMIQHLILSLRTLYNVSLPVEVFYGGEKDMTAAEIGVLDSFDNVTTHNLLDYFPTETRHWGGWSIKPYAMLASTFRRILFVDADVLFLQDPIAAVKRHPVFKRTNQLFFRDRFFHEERFIGGPELFREMNRYPSKYSRGLGYMRATEDGKSETHEMDSGMIAMDKGNLGVLMGLLLAAKMNAQDEREQVLYANTYGDKESFWFASEVLRVPYGFNQAYGGCFGQDDARMKGAACGIALLQLDSDMKPLFWNGGFMRDRHAMPANAEFLEFNRAGIDPEGTASWVDWERGFGRCMIPSHERNVRQLTMSEEDVLKRLKELFIQNLTII